MSRCWPPISCARSPRSWGATCAVSPRRRWPRCLAYPWPGNVRELIATLRRAVVLANGPLIEISDLRLDAAPRHVPPRREPPGERHGRGLLRPKPGSDGERDAILQALQESGFNMTRAAQLLGVARATLYRMLQRNRIELGQHYLVQPTEPEPNSGPEGRFRAGTKIGAAAVTRDRHPPETAVGRRRQGPVAGRSGLPVVASAARRNGCIGRLSHRQTRQLSHSTKVSGKSLTTHWQTLENKGFLRAIRSAIGWHADCSGRGSAGNRAKNH